MNAETLARPVQNDNADPALGGSPMASQAEHGQTPACEAPGGWAGALAGVIYGGPVGVVLTGLGTHWDRIPVTFGAIGGVVIGAMLGRCFGRFRHVSSSAACGAVLPMALILIDGIRRGRFTSPRALEELAEPRSLLIIGCIMLGGATIGGVLNLTAKGIRRLVG